MPPGREGALAVLLIAVLLVHDLLEPEKVPHKVPPLPRGVHEVDVVALVLVLRHGADQPLVVPTRVGLAARALLGVVEGEELHRLEGVLLVKVDVVVHRVVVARPEHLPLALHQVASRRAAWAVAYHQMHRVEDISRGLLPFLFLLLVLQPLLLPLLGVFSAVRRLVGPLRLLLLVLGPPRLLHVQPYRVDLPPLENRAPHARQHGLLDLLALRGGPYHMPLPRQVHVVECPREPRGGGALRLLLVGNVDPEGYVGGGVVQALDVLEKVRRGELDRHLPLRPLHVVVLIQ
mmetsp:Transcript_21977/g.53452  ORF Transcript_21977/g.53452 Transcript_21977/m.53452 type:complete len:290 (-) Transcript_21977:302-1171(-)